MREFLFTAKITNSSEWIEGYLHKCENAFVISNNDGLGHMIDVNTLCQYTGKTDKNGRKIWEHDIVKVFAQFDKDGNALYYYYEILWDEQYARFEGYEIYSAKTVLFDEMDDAEVVGSQIKGVVYSFPKEKICSFEKCQTCHIDICWTGQIAREQGREAYDEHIKMMDEAYAKEEENFRDTL